MNNHQLASSMRKLADVLEKLPPHPSLREGEPIDPELQLGCAMMLMFIRDIITISKNNTWTRENLLVALNAIQNDYEFFNCDLVSLIDKEDQDA